MTAAFALLGQVDLIPELLGFPEQFAEAANNLFIAVRRDLGAHQGYPCNCHSAVVAFRRETARVSCAAGNFRREWRAGHCDAIEPHLSPEEFRQNVPHHTDRPQFRLPALVLSWHGYPRMVILDAEHDPTTRSEETRPAREEPKNFLLTDDGYAERSRNLRLQIEELRAHLSRLEAENRRFRME